MRTVTVPAAASGMRLDAFLAGYAPQCSRRTARRVIADGAVRVNGRRVRKAHVVAEGDAVELPDALYESPQLQANPQIVVPVLYEDAALIAIDKPAGMPSHALRADESDTAANFLLARYPELSSVGRTDREAGIVHRLDTDTSGVLLAARTVAAYRALRRQFSARRVGKEYEALVHGDLAVAGVVRNPIAHDRHNRRKMRVCRGPVPRSRPAITRYRPLERFGAYTLVAVEIPTGVTHQIRVHLAWLGHPVVGDRLYGGDRCEHDPSRHLLHARRLTVVHPLTRRRLTLESPRPSDFEAFVRRQPAKRQAGTGRIRETRHQ
ncbi:MAG TPA: RluA family pseudouridine synthase [Candidatus Margulisiibacteriota bacterium]|nr:RluA family pseudouridine synthase [Candidatus Margulisiibacteriota bacterium]